MTYFPSLYTFLSLLFICQHIDCYLPSSELYRSHFRLWAIESNLVAEIKQKISQSDASEQFTKPPPIFSNKAPLFRQRQKKIKDKRSSDHKKILGRPKTPRPTRNRTLAKRRKMQQLATDINFQRVSTEEVCDIRGDSLIPLIETIVTAADKRKANYMHVMRVSPLTEVTSFMVVLEGNSKPQNQAIALSIEVSLLSQYLEILPVISVFS